MDLKLTSEWWNQMLAELCRLKVLNWRRRGPLLLIVAGLILLAYVGIEYTQMYTGQHRLVREWQQQNASHQGITARQPTRTDANDTLTRLSIPKINFDAVVVEGTTHKDLLLGPGHLKDTVEPGEIGNAAISAHRDTFFRHIHELEKGDQVVVQRGGKEYHYEVTGKQVVDPDDVFVLKPTKDAQLTLITCYPTYYIGPAPHRLIVFSRMVDNTATAASSSNGSIPGGSSAGSPQ